MPQIKPERRSQSRFGRSDSAAAHDHDRQGPNMSDHEYFGDVIRQVVSRRGLLKAGAVLAVASGQAWLGGAAAAAEHLSDSNQALEAGPRGVNFVPVVPNSEDRLVVPEGYEQRVVIRWGDPVLPGAPAFDVANQTAAAQARQFGYNNDFCGLVPLVLNWWLMVSNHQYTNEEMLFTGYDPYNPTEEQVRIAWAAHGISVVLLEGLRGGGLRARVDRLFNRRITATTRFTLRGPAAGSSYLTTSADPGGTTVLGTLNNGGGGVTPWGTVLSAEQSFNQYFANANQVADPRTQLRLTRYGVVGEESARKWERFDRRFDVAQEPNEVNRFGWVVEVDPLAPHQDPVKHTALGRFKHGAATLQVAGDARVVCYMGDAEAFDYIYKFVSDERMQRGISVRNREHNKRLLDAGTLYVARFRGDSPAAEVDGTGHLPFDGEFDGSGEWIPLAHNDQSFVPGFTADEVYVFTRLAADAVGATKMDRPADVESNPRTGRIYAALTNNTNRTAAQADEANPRAVNRHGHVLELEERGGDHNGVSFAWRLLLVCGDPADPATYFAGYDKSQVSPLSCPESLAFDRHGNLWIATGGNGLGANDGLFVVPLDGTERGHVKQFLTVPLAAETCGPVIEPHCVLVSVQHPGEGGSIEAPTSHWPDGSTRQPRPAVAAVYRPGRWWPGLIGE